MSLKTVPAHDLPVSLVIPVRNEEESIEDLIESICRQTRQPDEIVFVDGGSTDGTVKLVEKLMRQRAEAGSHGERESVTGNREPFRTSSGGASEVFPILRLIKTDGATPGKGRNIGIKAASHEWIALTDAGIRLEKGWLENLIEVGSQTGADVVYGNLSPVINNFFEKCATITYVAPRKPGAIRCKFIASALINKRVSEAVGGFPDLRAAEDLMFMEAVEAAGFHTVTATQAMVHWQLGPNLTSTFRKFTLYSKHNVWAGRQWDWHHGVVRQYLFLVLFLVLAFLHSLWWLLGIPLWLFARTTKRILAHRFEFGAATLFNPLVFFGVAGLILVIDAATFVGWGQALMSQQSTVGSQQSE
jgi:glycosyltransferase involved in cell wall biosynthesis